MSNPPSPQSDPHASHSHSHQHDPLQPFSSFFECCISEDSGKLSDKIQQLRQNYAEHQITAEVITPNQAIFIEKDMIVGDLLLNFPEIRPVLEDIHPLGLMSPLINQISLEIFLSDINVDPELICQQLSTLINTK